MDELTTLAIKAALDHNWDEALKINKKILAQGPSEDCLLRMAHAYFSQGELKKAQESAKKALRLSPSNHLAVKLLEKCKNTKSVKTRSVFTKVNLKAFVGTDVNIKLVKLVHTGTPSIIASLLPGESLKIVAASNKVHVETEEGVYIGRLPDDISLKICSSKEKHFEALVKSAVPNAVTVLLREV